MIAWLDLVAFVQTNHCCNLQDSHVAWTLENKSSLITLNPQSSFIHSLWSISGSYGKANRTATL